MDELVESLRNYIPRYVGPNEIVERARIARLQLYGDPNEEEEDWSPTVNLDQFQEKDFDFDFEVEIVPRRKIKYEQKVTVKIPTMRAEVACFLASLGDEVDIICREHFMTEGMDIEPPDNGEYTVLDMKFDRRLDVLDMLAEMHKPTLIDNFKKYGIDDEEVISYNQYEYLRYSRYLRLTNSALNKATKNVTSITGIGYYHAYKEIFKEIEPEDRVVMYGMEPLGGAPFLACEGEIVDVIMPPGRKKRKARHRKSREGTINDILDTPADVLVYHDVQYDRKTKLRLGMRGVKEKEKLKTLLHHFRKGIIYSDIVGQEPIGHIVSHVKHRSHNEHIIYHCVQGPVSEPPYYDLELANAERNEMFQTKKVGKLKQELWPELKISKGIDGLTLVLPNSNHSRMDIFQVGSQEEFIDLCKKDEKISGGDLLTEKYPRPIVFQDLICVGNHYAFFAALHNTYPEAQFDSEVGWYVE